MECLYDLPSTFPRQLSVSKMECVQGTGNAYFSCKCNCPRKSLNKFLTNLIHMSSVINVEKSKTCGRVLFYNCYHAGFFVSFSVKFKSQWCVISDCKHHIVQYCLDCTIWIWNFCWLLSCPVPAKYQRFRANNHSDNKHFYNYQPSYSWCAVLHQRIFC